jgi:hypothetical protein
MAAKPKEKPGNNEEQHRRILLDLIELTDIVVIFMDGDYGPLIFMIVWHFDSLKSMQDGLTP